MQLVWLEVFFYFFQIDAAWSELDPSVWFAGRPEVWELIGVKAVLFLQIERLMDYLAVYETAVLNAINCLLFFIWVFMLYILYI